MDVLFLGVIYGNTIGDSGIQGHLNIIFFLGKGIIVWLLKTKHSYAKNVGRNLRSPLANRNSTLRRDLKTSRLVAAIAATSAAAAVMAVKPVRCSR